MKIHIRTLVANHAGRMLWHDKHEKEIIRKFLNDVGFYCLTGTGDSLDIFAVPTDSLWKRLLWIMYFAVVVQK